MRPNKRWQGPVSSAMVLNATIGNAQLNAVVQPTNPSGKTRLQLQRKDRPRGELARISRLWLVWVIIASPAYGQVGYPGERVSIASEGSQASSTSNQLANDSFPEAWTASRNESLDRTQSDQTRPDRARQGTSSVVTASGQQPVGGSTDRTTASKSSAGESEEATAPSRGIPLPPPSKSHQSDDDSSGSSTFKSVISVGSSLLIVIGLFLGVAWCYRKGLQTSLGGGQVPKQVVRVLGRTPIAARQQLVLVRFGSKLVLVSVVQGDARTISEITDPLEVDQLAGLCESDQPESITSSFRSILAQGGGR